MKFIFADLGVLTVNQLMARTRRCFACSLGLFFLLSIHFAGLYLSPTGRASQNHMADGVIIFAVMELLVWVSFARAWNEFKRRSLIEQPRSNQSA